MDGVLILSCIYLSLYHSTHCDGLYVVLQFVRLAPKQKWLVFFLFRWTVNVVATVEHSSMNHPFKRFVSKHAVQIALYLLIRGILEFSIPAENVVK